MSQALLSDTDRRRNHNTRLCQKVAMLPDSSARSSGPSWHVPLLASPTSPPIRPAPPLRGPAPFDAASLLFRGCLYAQSVGANSARLYFTVEQHHLQPGIHGLYPAEVCRSLPPFTRTAEPIAGPRVCCTTFVSDLGRWAISSYELILLPPRCDVLGQARCNKLSRWSSRHIWCSKPISGYARCRPKPTMYLAFLEADLAPVVQVLYAARAAGTGADAGILLGHRALQPSLSYSPCEYSLPTTLNP